MVIQSAVDPRGLTLLSPKTISISQCTNQILRNIPSHDDTSALVGIGFRHDDASALVVSIVDSHDNAGALVVGIVDIGIRHCG